MELTATDAGQLALTFLMDEWEIDPDEREWFTVLNARQMGESWYVVEVGIEGLPDIWVVQVYDTQECDPSYTFKSPMSHSEDRSDVSELPERIAEVIVAERGTGR